MPANDREVFQYLTSNPDTPIEIDLLTFAIFAQEMREWHKLIENQRQAPPTQPEIDAWVSQITVWRFDQMREEAARFFDNAARAYLSEEIENLKKQVFQDTIIREVKAAGGFWRQLALAVIGAVLSPLIIGLIIASALLYDKWYPTISRVADHTKPSVTAPPSSPPKPN